MRTLRTLRSLLLALKPLTAFFVLAPNDLLRERPFRRLWLSTLLSSFGGQISMLALPLTAAVLLHATPTQMGFLTFAALLPFLLFSLPAGVWLDRVRKLPVYVGGEILLGLALATVPIAWWMGWLTMSWLYVLEFIVGMVHAVSGTAAQVVLTQAVPRERLVEAHAKNALAQSGAEVAGPGFAGFLIKLVGAPLACLVDAVLLITSALILRGIPLQEQVAPRSNASFWVDLKTGVRFIVTNRLLLTMAVLLGLWQMCHHAALVVQILVATRTLGLSEQQVGLCFVGTGVGSVLASLWGHRLSQHIGPGPSLVVGMALCGAGWLLLACATAGPWGVAAFALMLFMFAVGATLIFINFLALRQAVTPTALLGRMTSAMRWLTLMAAGPGALLGGWLGEHLGLQASLVFAGGTCLVVALGASRLPLIRGLRQLPQPDEVPQSTNA